MNYRETLAALVSAVPLREKTEKSRNTAERNRLIFARYTGLDGQGGDTLEAIGKTYNLTRECIRQIVNRLDKKMMIDSGSEREIRIMIDLVKTSTPVESRALSEKAVKEKMLDSASFDLINPAIYFASKLDIDLDAYVEKTNKGLFLIPNGFEIKPDQLISEAAKVVNRYGVCSVSSLIVRFGLKDDAQIRSYIQSSMEASGNCVWIDGENEHFYLDRDRTSRMDRRLEQVFNVYQSVKLDKLYQALSRSLRQATDNCEQSPEYQAFVGEEKPKGHQDEKNRRMAIDENTLKRYLTSRGYKISRHNIVTLGQKATPENPALPLEIDVINILKDQTRGQMREIDLETKLSIAPKTNDHYSFVTTTYYSALMIRPKRGYLELLGSPY